MKAIIEGPPGPGVGAPLWRRLLWFVGLAAAAGGATLLAAYGLRALLPSP